MGRIALVGGNEFRENCESMDRVVLAATGVERPSVAIIPTAAAGQGPSKAAANGVGYFERLGAEAWPLMVLSSTDADDPKFVSRLDDADLVYLTGGDPEHLLEVLDGSALLDSLKRILGKGAVVAGSSAGAMVMGSWMGFRDWRPALGVVPNIAVLPHHERSDPDSTVTRITGALPSGISALGVDVGTGCLSGDDGWTVVGDGAVVLYCGGHWERFESGAVVPLEVSLNV
jgi:cyanophycinase